jgi:hypothetical protein
MMIWLEYFQEAKVLNRGMFGEELHIIYLNAMMGHQGISNNMQ